MPENQTAWSSFNQGIKETVNQTGRKETGRQREPGAGWRTAGVGLAERTPGEAADCMGGAG